WVESVIYREDQEGHQVSFSLHHFYAHFLQIKTYVYSKNWRTMLIHSIFFDQPFAHNNPLRDPFPSMLWTSSSASIGPYSVSSDIIQDQVTSFKHRISADQVNKERLPLDFYYVGGGYFYSPYEPSSAGFIAKLAGEWLEGSLLDFQ